VTEVDVESLRPLFAGRLHTDAADTAPSLTDWRRKWTGAALAVAEPDTTADVAAVVRWCRDHSVPIVPQGGNTGLSGGATPDSSGTALVLSLRRLQRVRRIDTVGNTIEVEAGVTLERLQEVAREAGRLFPLSLAAEGSCTIGGNLATNAGGVEVLRYGNARDLCLGIEVVTADGEIWDGLRHLRKDNSGYDLRDLFIGSEGTLGIITAGVLRLFPLPAEQAAAFVAVPSPAAAVALLELAQSRLDASLTAFELMSDVCVRLLVKRVEAARLPLRERSPWYVLLEVSEMQPGARAAEAIERVLQTAIEAGVATDATISDSEARYDAIWAIREEVTEAQAREGPSIKHDISLPISEIADFVRETDAAVDAACPGLQKVTFGHLGDGNLHYNLSPPPVPRDVDAFVALEPRLNRIVHDAVMARGGSISAEHGLGALRRDEAARYKSTVELALLRAVKDALDPQHLLNPSKALP
jgi:FAD/FMN-containing dehydrogenase